MAENALTERIITSDACIAEGAEWLAAHAPCFAPVIAVAAPLPLRLRDDGFKALMSAIVSQQISTSAAASIWARLEAAGLTDPATVLAASEDDLRAVGLSRPKIRYATALAEAGIDYAALRDLPSDAVIKTLVAVKGIGVWTAEIYAMFSLGRADVFAHGDLALQEAARVLLDLPKRPTEAEMRKIAADWSPWRSVAARALWAYYRMDKGREGIR